MFNQKSVMGGFENSVGRSESAYGFHHQGFLPGWIQYHPFRFCDIGNERYNKFV